MQIEAGSSECDNWWFDSSRLGGIVRSSVRSKKENRSPREDTRPRGDTIIIYRPSGRTLLQGHPGSTWRRRAEKSLPKTKGATASEDDDGRSKIESPAPARSTSWSVETKRPREVKENASKPYNSSTFGTWKHPEGSEEWGGVANEARKIQTWRRDPEERRQMVNNKLEKYIFFSWFFFGSFSECSKPCLAKPWKVFTEGSALRGEMSVFLGFIFLIRYYTFIFFLVRFIVMWDGWRRWRDEVSFLATAAHFWYLFEGIFVSFSLWGFGNLII